MIELGELEASWQEFEKRNVRVIAMAVPVTEQDWKDASETKDQFKHLTILLDANRHFADRFGFVHPHSHPEGKDTLGPTTILLDETATVRRMLRSERHIARPAPKEVLAALDEHVLKK